MAFIEVKGITKKFGGLTAVDNVDFEIEQGKITAIIGPNGAGKSTFFNLINGFHKPTSGRILFEGKDITKIPVHKGAHLGIARTFQTTHLFEQSTVVDNVIVGHRLRTKSNLFDAVFRTRREKQEEKKAYEIAMGALEFVGMAHLADTPVSTITQEAKKRVAIALALATGPKVMFLDEPAAGINPEETDGLAQLMKKIAASGITVCTIEHKMQMIMGMADKIMVLNQGAKIAEGTPDEIKNNPVVIEAYLGGEAIAEVN
ncbi:ABC transporter ATP-binding protein [Microbacterium sp. APC 3898]|uniref:ABC transporter ATP-binding protein n=1 Tax=Planococcus notacanthi TaxID=3035188 RepID=A0ABT7ZN05_9BACL|nr:MULTISPECIES: ABC transporter ATP-binding protein [Terrabacteria group]MDN3428037.1 ABC transporter ATP-binding protein [Planococcus sp. APC 4016]MDN3498428.1 ABC transporter ATP-binding protein [Microbacterium sp. APC 3898]